MSVPVLWSAAALLLFAGLLCSCPGKDEPGRYSNRGKGFALDFPPEWEIREGEMGLDVIGLSRLEGPSDQYRENVSVASTGMQSDMDSDAILDANIPNMIRIVTDFKPSERGYKQIGDRRAASLQYTQRQGQFHLQAVVYALPGKDRAFLIYCTAEEPAASRFADKFDAIVSSFEVKK